MVSRNPKMKEKDMPEKTIPNVPKETFCQHRDAIYRRSEVPDSFVVEGKVGQLPWVWGHSLGEAYVQADRANRRMGISEEEVDRIVVSSMRVTK